MSFFRNKYKGLLRKWRVFWSINWYKTLYFNYKKLPFQSAKKLPVLFYGRVKFSDISGSIQINAPIEMGMIGFGQRFEKMTRSKGIAEINLQGTVVFNGYTHIAKDCFFYVGKNGYCEFGTMSAFGSEVKFFCTKKITIGNWTGIGYESQILDSNSHPMLNTQTKEQYPVSAEIVLGDYNAVSNRVSIMPGTKTPNNCVIASNSLCSGDYTGLGEQVLIGGVPAKLIRENFARDWESEKEVLKRNKIFKF